MLNGINPCPYLLECSFWYIMNMDFPWCIELNINLTLLVYVLWLAAADWKCLCPLCGNVHVTNRCGFQVHCNQLHFYIVSWYDSPSIRLGPRSVNFKWNFEVKKHFFRFSKLLKKTRSLRFKGNACGVNMK